jgi:hypothetical protein
MAKLARHAQRLDDWDFDVFAVGEITKHPLVFVAYSLLSGFDMIHSFKLDESVVERYLKKIESCYTDTPYHNALHAADVTQNLNYFIAKCGLSTAARLGPELLLSCILTPVVHDVGHFGVNNPFLIGSSHDLAVRYNDQSPMENMHCATAFQAMQEEGHDVLAPLGTQVCADVPTTMFRRLDVFKCFRCFSTFFDVFFCRFIATSHHRLKNLVFPTPALSPYLTPLLLSHLSSSHPPTPPSPHPPPPPHSLSLPVEERCPLLDDPDGTGH